MNQDAVPETCPHCHSGRVARIAYRLPSEETFESAECGEFMLGGCVVDLRRSPDCKVRAEEGPAV